MRWSPAAVSFQPIGRTHSQVRGERSRGLLPIAAWNAICRLLTGRRCYAGGRSREHSFTEQLAFATILRVGGKLFAARSDTLGERLTLEPLAGSGSVRLVLPAIIEAVEGTTVAVTLVGRDGTAVLVAGAGQPAEVPSGEYQLQIVSLSLPGLEDARRWNFDFSADASRQRPWREVKTGATLDVDPIGALDLEIDIEGNKMVCKPGELVTVLPRLYTGDGLLIRACYRGSESADERNHSKCSVALVGADGPSEIKPALATCQSGFL